MNRDFTDRLKAVLAFLAVLGIVYLQYRKWHLDHADNLGYLMEAMDGIWRGTPHWRAYQNRLLAPLIYLGLDRLTDQAYLILVQTGLFALGMTLYAMLRQRGVDTLAAVGWVCLAALIWLLEQHNSFYLWDLIEAGWLLCLVYAALQGQLQRWIYPLFVVALFNRESVVFVALAWLVSGAVLLSQGNPQGKRRLGQASLMLVVSVLFVELTRKWLFQHSILSGVGLDDAHAQFENHWQWATNWGVLVNQLRSATPLLLILLWYALTFGQMVHNGQARRNADLIGVGVALLVYFASIFVFGALLEMRLYQPFAWALALAWPGLLSRPAAVPQAG